MIWHAYTTRPKKEFAVARELTALGAETVVPYRLRPRRRQGKPPATIRAALIPGYVFAGWYDSAPCLDRNVIKGLRGHVPHPDTGEPAVLTARDVAAARAVAEIQPLVARRALEPGNRVILTKGPFADHIAHLKAIVAGKGIVPLKIFGATRDVVVALDDLEAA